jgi:hypothetical protein
VAREATPPPLSCNSTPASHREKRRGGREEVCEDVCLQLTMTNSMTRLALLAVLTVGVPSAKLAVGERQEMGKL